MAAINKIRLSRVADLSSWERPHLMLLAVGFIAAVVSIVLFSTSIADIPEGLSVDARFAIRGKQKLPTDIVVVGVDDKTLQALGEWPFTAAVHGQVIGNLVTLNAKVIAYDLREAQVAPGSGVDVLATAIAEAGPRLLLSESGGGAPSILGRGVVPGAPYRVGSPLLPTDPGGEVRHFPYIASGKPSFAIAAAEIATGKTVPRGPFGGKGAWIDYHGTKTLTYASFLDLYNASAPASLFTNKIVVVGAFAPALNDIDSTPFGQMAGANILGEAISTILRNFPLSDTPWIVGFLVIIVLAFAPPVAALRLRPVLGLLAAVALAVIYLVFAQLLFQAGYIIPVFTPLLALALAAIGTLFLRVLIEAYERRRVRDVFSRFVDERVVDQVLEQTGGSVKLGGQSRECTIMFSDLRGFTTYSEGRSPEAVLDILNAYTEEMSQAILEHEGTLLAFLGDGILALFGAPLDQPDHPDRALAAARDMIQRLDKFNKDQQAKGNDVNFRMGIGINTGTVMVGNVGSKRRVEYTAIGDTVNTASRIEGLTKGTEHQIYLAESTFEGLTHQRKNLEAVGELDIRGRTTGVKIWGVKEEAAG